MRRAALLAGIALLPTIGVGPAPGATPYSAHDVMATTAQTSWSPDGRHVAYLKASWPFWLLTLAAVDGSGETVVGSTFSATWSPDGQRIAVVYTGVFDLASGRMFPITGNPTSTFNWAPNGWQIAYTAFPVGQKHLMVSGWDGSGARALSSGAQQPTDPSWSPNGQEIAYGNYWYEGDSLRAISLFGGGRTIVPGPPLFSRWPRWSPDGERLSYTTNSGVVVALRDGSGWRTLSGDRYKYRRTSWSASGQWIVADSEFDDVVELIEVDGPRRMTVRDARSTSWSPRSDEIAYSTNGYVYIRAMSGARRRIVAGRAPDWSPDGARLSFLARPFKRVKRFHHCPERLFVIGVDGTGKQPIGICEMADDRGVGRIQGTNGPDVIYGGPGADHLRGGRGQDVIEGGFGADRIHAGDGEHDEVDCGPGTDVAFVGTLDVVSEDCERVVRR